MENNEDFGLEEFRSVLFGGDGYQTGSETDDSEDTETEDGQEDTADEAAETAEAETDKGHETTSKEQESGAEERAEPDSAENAAQTFTLKVNKEERTVSLEEMTAYAQKGLDYDRVKGQNEQLRQSNTDLQTKLDGMTAQQGALDVLGMIAEKSSTTLDQLVESLYVNFRKNSGASEDAAREELKSARLEKELSGLKAKESRQQDEKTDAESRFQRDVEEFNREYPGVSLSEELVNKLVPDIQNGMSLSAAYRKLEKAQDAQKIADLERQLSAKVQNEKNRKSSPGSQKDSGGSGKHSDIDVFRSVLFG